MEKERREEVLAIIERAGDTENNEVKWDEKGVPHSTKKTDIARGKKSRKSGLDFESRVRKDLEEKGWIVCKWVNNVELSEKRIAPAKRKFNPFSKVMTLGTGFPDFIAFQLVGDKMYNVMGVEVKVNGQLDREEREKCAFLIENKVFSDIAIAKKGKDGREIKIEYAFFKEKYLDKKD